MGECVDRVTLLRNDCRSNCRRIARVGLLGRPLLVPAYGVRWPEFVPVGFHKLAPGDQHPAQVGREVLS